MRAEKTTKKLVQSYRQRWLQKGRAEDRSHKGLLTERPGGHRSGLARAGRGSWRNQVARRAVDRTVQENSRHGRACGARRSPQGGCPCVLEDLNGNHSWASPLQCRGCAPGGRGSRGQRLALTDFVGGSGEDSSSESL